MKVEGAGAPTLAEMRVRRTAAELAAWGESVLRNLLAEHMDHFHGRVGNWKQFRDELLPLWAYARTLDPTAGFEFEPVLGSDPYDVLVYLHGALHRHLEVTCALEENEHERDRMLAENGRVLLSGPVAYAQIDRKKVAYINQVNDSGVMVDWQIGTVLSAIEKKADKKPPPGTDLLVGVPDDFRFTIHPWAAQRLHDAVARRVRELQLPYRSILVIGVDSARIFFESRLTPAA